MEGKHATPLIRELNREEIDVVLARNNVGRVAFAHDNRIDIHPVHYVYSQGWIYGRTSAHGQKDVTFSDTAYRWRPVAFEVDEVEELFKWRSVVVRGGFYLLRRDGSPPEREAWEQAVAAMRTLIPETLREGDPVPLRTLFFRIAVQDVTGREAMPEGGGEQEPPVRS